MRGTRRSTRRVLLLTRGYPAGRLEPAHPPRVLSECGGCAPTDARPRSLASRLRPHRQHDAPRSRARTRGGPAQPPAADAHSPSELRSRCRPAGGVGAQPPQIETPRAGGWARAARSAGSSGMGAWGAQPPIAATRTRPRAAVALPTRRGRGGCAPTDRNSEGGRVGQSRAQRVLVRDGGVGGAAPHRRHALDLGAALALPTRRGRGGAAPTDRNSEGGRVGRAARSALAPRYGAAMTRASAARWAAPRSGMGIRPKKSTARAARPSSAWTGVLAWNGVSSSGSSSTIVRTQRR